MVEWREMIAKIQDINLCAENDRMIWKLELSGRFSVKSVYKIMLSGGEKDERAIFFWMVWKDRLQTVEQLIIGKWNGVAECKLCDQLETRDHLLLCCSIARQFGVG
ncbi:hypothetical protein U9M48_012777 [Paspalum notatum var. saurae]|uniref:Reverse transcriptase zinc-binding domain-containing protein n=1 Tax=Paspalum notatum var. saurae TaxID=547442 RepID=A0AAQ3T0W6_PASNO